MDGALAGQHAPPAVHELAAQGPGVQAPRQVVGKSGQDALAHLRPVDAPLGGVEALGLRDLQKLLEERADLAGRLGVDAQPAAGVQR